MVRALWTAASGMTSQQLNVDTISNNLANVNTTGYKKETTNFKSLLYQTMESANVPGVQQPTSMQVGHGVRTLGNSRNYSMGILQETGNKTDMAIEGNGFFTVLKGDQMTYTKDGSFRISLTEDGSYALVTSDGNPVLSVEDEPILVGNEVSADKLVIGKDGSVYYTDEETKTRMDIAQLKIVQFSNIEGLEAIGSNLYIGTPASGEPLVEGDSDGLTKSTIRTGYLEGSNVQVAEEMVKLIVAQRAYELNSTAIKAADTMLQQANELKRG
jgi:flagellar basal-body rod protein FlgG